MEMVATLFYVNISSNLHALAYLYIHKCGYLGQFGYVLTNLIEPEINSQIKQIKHLVTLKGLCAWVTHPLH